MHNHLQPSLHDGHDDGDRIQDWVTQQYLEPELNSFVKLGDGVQYSQLLERPDSPLEDFTWSSSAASSTPALNSVLVKDEDSARDTSAEGTEMDAHSTFNALMAKHQSLPPMTFKRGRLSDDSSSSSGGCDESTDQHEQYLTMGTDKPLPPPPPPSPPHTTENTYVAPTRSRHPSIVSLTGYHLPSSVQISSTPSPRSSFVSLSRQSSFTGHSSAHGHSSTGAASHMRQSSLSRQPSLGLLSPSASSTLFEEDDRADLPITPITSEGDASSADSVMRERDRSHSNTLQIKAERRRSGKPTGLGVSGGCKPILKHARSDSKSDYRPVSGHARGLSRSTSGSGASLLSHSSSLRRQSSVNSIYSSNSGGSSGGNRVITRHASAGNLLSRPNHSTPHTHTHSPSLPCPPSLLPPHSLPVRRSVASRLSTASATGSTHASIHFADDNGDVQAATSSPSTSALKHSPSTSMSLSLLAPPPTATFAPSSGMLGSSSGSATASTPRNRDAVYIDAVDSEEVQKRLAALLAASDPTNTISDSQTAEAHMQDQGEEPSQEIDYYEDDKSGVYINPSQVEGVERSVARNSHPEIAQATQMTTVDEQVPEVEQSHWSPASTNSELPLSPPTFSKHTSAYGLGIGTISSVPGISLGLVGAPPSSKRKSKAKKDKEDSNSRKRKSVSSGSKEVEERVEEASGSSPDEGVPKRPGQRQRLASLIARAIGANGFNGSSTTMLNTSVASESSVETSGTSSPIHTVSDLDLESTKGPASPTVSIPSQRVRALSNANKPSPLRIEVTPFSQSTSSITSPGPSTASTARPRAISLTPNPTPPLSPSKTSFFGRMRSGSQVSSISQKTTSTTFSTTTTSTTSSTSSAGFGSVLDKFPSPGDEEDHRWEVRTSVLPEEDEEDVRKSEDSEPEDDGAYYVMAFSKNYDKGKRSSKSPVREKQDDGDATETEAEDLVSKNIVEHLPPLPRHSRSIKDSESRPSSQIHIQTAFRPTSVAKSSLFVPLPLSPPPSLSPSPILPVNSLRMPSPSNDLLDSDPFAATSSPAATAASTPGNGSPAVTPGNSSPASYFNNHPSPFGAKPAVTGHHYPYSSRALQASKSMSTLPKSAAAAIAADIANGAKSLISPGDLPPSKAWKNFDVQQEHAVSPPMSPTFGHGSKPYSLPPSPGSSPVSPIKKSTKSKLRMSVAGLVSRLHLGGSSQHPSSRRESPTAVPLPPPTPGEDFTMPMLPTPTMTPTVPSAPTPPLLPSHFPPSEFIDDEGDYDDDDDYDTDMVTPPFSPTTSSPPTPSLYGEPVLKRKSLGLGLGSGEDGTVGSSRLSLSSITSRSKKAKKRRLVISGVAIDDEQAYEAVKEWCSTFGQIRQITRKPNGNLHVDFRSASVAETVCRVQATVNIKGAGSVALSWYTGKDKGRDGVDLRI